MYVLFTNHWFFKERLIDDRGAYAKLKKPVLPSDAEATLKVGFEM